MKYLKLIVYLVFAQLMTSPVWAQHNFGAGIVLGNPTGFTVQYFLGQANAIDGTLSFLGSNHTYLHASYLWMQPKLFAAGRFPVSWYFGIGGRLITHNHSRDYDHHGHYYHHDHDNSLQIGPRVPVGLRLMFNDPRIEVFAELSLTMDVLPSTSSDLGLGIGGRFYF